MKVSTVHVFHAPKVSDTSDECAYDLSGIAEIIWSKPGGPLDPDGTDMEKLGWCSFENEEPLQPIHSNDLLLFGARLDEVRIPGPLWKQRYRKLEEAWLLENGVRKVPKSVQADLWEQAMRYLRRRVPPSVKHFECVLHLERGELYVFAPRAMADAIAELFTQNTGIDLQREDAGWLCQISAGGRAYFDESIDHAPIVRLELENLANLEAFDAALIPGTIVDDALARALTDRHDFARRVSHLGAGFLLFLWWRSMQEQPENTKVNMGGHLTLASWEKSCAIKGGSPSLTEAAGRCLARGYLPKTVGLLVSVTPDAEEGQKRELDFKVTMTARGLELSGVRLPRTFITRDEYEMLAREQIERIDILRGALREAFEAFIAWRTRIGWEERWEVLREWARRLAGEGLTGGEVVYELDDVDGGDT